VQSFAPPMSMPTQYPTIPSQAILTIYF